MSGGGKKCFHKMFVILNTKVKVLFLIIINFGRELTKLNYASVSIYMGIKPLQSREH